jgi:hypothetical protein
MDMHAVFAAAGPAFARNATLQDTFDNVHVYSLVRDAPTRVLCDAAI